MTRYDLLLADADDTLLDFAAAEDKALNAACAAAGLMITPEQAARYKEINAALWQAFARREVTQDALKVLRFERFLAEIGFAHDPRDLAARFVEALALQTDEMDGAYDFLRAASARVPVVIVTNGIASVQRGRFGSSRLNAFLSGHVISGEVGFSKPDPRIFDRALEGRGVPKARALMLGDDLNSDIAGAIAAGIDCCWFNPAGRENRTQHTPTYIIKRLEEALSWL